MRRVFILFFILVVLISCNSLKLTEEEARSLIIEANGFIKPEPIAIYLRYIRRDSALYREIKHLEREGYLTKKYKETNSSKSEFRTSKYLIISGKDKHLLITEKGKDLIEFIEYDKETGYTFAPFTHYLDLQEITKIVINNKNKTAVVKYLVGYFRTDYFIHLSRIDKKEMDKASKNLEGYGKEMWLKKSDQGWKITKNVNSPIESK